MSEETFGQQRGEFGPEGDSTLDLQRYLRVLIKRKWLIISSVVVVVGLAAVWTFTRVKIYGAKATVLVERQAPQVLGGEVREVVDTSISSWRAKEYLETQKRVVTSKAMCRRVAEQLHLAKDAKFWASSQGALAKDLTADAAADVLRGLVSAEPVRDASLMEIRVMHQDPEVAARLANAFARNYKDQILEYKVSSASGAVKWLADQLDDLKKQLEEAELALHEFKKRNNIVSVSLESKQTLIARQIERISDALTEIRLKRMGQAAKRKQLQGYRKTDPLDMPVGMLSNSATLKTLKQTYIEQHRKFVALKERYLEQHPLVKQQKAKLDVVRRDLQREVKNSLAEDETRFREIRDNEGQLAGALQKAKDEALVLNKREVEYQRLKRTQENTAKLYGLVLTRMKETDLSAQLRVSNIRLLDRAVASVVPVYPRVQLNLLIATMLGLMLGIGLAFLVDTLDSTVKSQTEVEQTAGLVFLGLLPRIPGSEEPKGGRRPAPRPELDLIVHRNPKSAIAESCRSIRTNLLFTATDRTLKTIVVTSPGPREGKTTSAVSLAIVMAQAGGKVLLVDTDMRKPRLHKIFGVPGAEGLTSVLLGDGNLDEVIKTSEVPGLHILPCGHVPPNPAEICQGERFRELLDQLSERFDRVILDSPPTMAVTDGVILSTLVDGTLVVARTGFTSRTGLTETTRQIRDVGGHLLGCVLNDMDIKEHGYSYYRYRRYGKYYQYGYRRYGYSTYGDPEEETSHSS